MKKLLKALRDKRAEKKNKSRWGKLAVALSLLVFAGVSWRLAIPVVTLTPEVTCGYEEHTHEGDCYETVLTCTLEETEGHTHGGDCHTETVTLICALEEGVQEEPVQEEPVQEEPVQEEPVQEEVESESEPMLELQAEPAHVHSDSCYHVEQELSCEQVEQTGHTHGDDCYETKLTCTKTEHTHNRGCYSDSTADVESASTWEATLPDEPLTGIWMDDLLAVAESQMGYTESTRNFIVDESGTQRGYTRYGHWYGDHYGHWCAMYVSFCLNYADISEEYFPREANCARWIEALEKLELYQTAEDYEPQVGDLIFFRNSNGTARHVGIVRELVFTEEGELDLVRTIEGNTSDSVNHREYSVNDEDIMGYGLLVQAYEDYLLTLEEQVQPMQMMRLLGAGNTVTFYEGYTEGHKASDIATNQYYITKKTYTLQDDFNPFTGSDHTASGAIISESVIAYCYNHEYTRPNVYSGDPNDKVNTGGHTHYEQLTEDQDFIITLDSDRTTYIAYDSNTRKLIPLDRNGDMVAQAETLRNTLLRIIYYGYGGPGASTAVSGGISDERYRRATQRAIYYFTDGYNVNGTDYAGYSSYGTEYQVYQKLIKGTDLPPVPENLTLNIYQYKGDSSYYTSGSNSKHPKGNAENNFQNLITVEIVEKKQSVSFMKNSIDVNGETGPLAGAELELYTADGQTLLKQWTSEEASKKFGLDPGSYMLREASAPAGYAVFPDIWFTLDEDGQVTIDRVAGYEEGEDYSQVVTVDNSQVNLYDTKLTSVTVQKVWDGAQPQPITVQLQLNGVDVEGTQVTLSEENNWTYTWENLVDYGDRTVYAVKELISYGADYTPEYIGWVELTETTTDGTEGSWQSASTLVPGKRYAFGSNNYAMVFNGNYVVLGSGFSVNNVSSSQIWRAEDAGNGAVYLYNEGTGRYIGKASNSNYLAPVSRTSNALAFTYGSNRHLKSSVYGDVKLYTEYSTYYLGLFNSINSYPNFTLYQWQDPETVEVGTGEWVYRIRNTEVETVSCKVVKTWEPGLNTEPVTVRLLWNGEVVEGSDVILSEENGWTYTWTGLADNGTYSVEELVPEGASYRTGFIETIGNSSTADRTRVYDDATVYQAKSKQGKIAILNTATGAQDSYWSACIGADMGDAPGTADSYAGDYRKITNATQEDVARLVKDDGVTLTDSMYWQMLRVLYVYERDYAGSGDQSKWSGMQIVLDNIFHPDKGVSSHPDNQIFQEARNNTGLDEAIRNTMTIDLYQSVGGGTGIKLPQHTVRAHILGEEGYIRVHNESLGKEPTGEINLTKVDAESGALLAGVTFALYDSEGNQVAEGTTDETGTLSFTELPYGDYTLRETGTLDGYVLPDREIQLALNADGMTLYSSGMVWLEDAIETESTSTVIRIVTVDSNSRYRISGSMHQVANRSTGTEDSLWALGVNSSRKVPGADSGTSTGSYRKTAYAGYEQVKNAIEPYTEASFTEANFMEMKRVLYWFLQTNRNYTNLEAAQQVLRYITDKDTVYEDGTWSTAFTACHNAAYDNSLDDLINQRLSVHLYQDMEGAVALQNMVAATLNPEVTGNGLKIGNSQVHNEVIELPATGGEGTAHLYLAGLSLLLGVVGLQLLRKRKVN